LDHCIQDGFSFECCRCECEHQTAEQSWASRFAQKNGLSIFDAVQTLKTQDGRCSICRTPICLLNRRTWAIDHDHKCCPSGRACESCFRGVLCGNCNRMLGLALDSVRTLNNAIEYLTTNKKRRAAIRQKEVRQKRIAEQEKIRRIHVVSKTMTYRQKEVFDFISASVFRGVAPSFKEIAAAVNLRSLATVHKHVDALEAKGFIQRGYNEARSIKILRQAA
jgi:DNA-binding MarR family transcriptional regulator